MQANSELVNSTFELASIGRHSKQGLKPSVRIERLWLGVVWAGCNVPCYQSRFGLS